MTATRHVDLAGRGALAVLGFSIPVSVALDNVLLVACFALWLAGGSWRRKLQALRGNPVFVAALALFALLALGLAWGERDPGDGALYLAKYVDLALVAPLAFLARDAAARAWAIRAFAASLGLVLVLSFLLQSGLLPPTRWWLGDAANPVVFKHHLTHNLLMAFAAFLFAELALAARTPRGRGLLWLASFLAAVNVLFMVQGRTGYVVLAALSVYLGYRLRGWRGAGVAAAGVLAAVCILSVTPGTFATRMQTFVEEYRAWRPGEATQTSTGLRLEFYRNTAALIRDHPLLGVGTGGFPRAYAGRLQYPGAARTRNPHNEYLHIAAQTGLAGLAALMWLFFVQWRAAPRLAAPGDGHLARALVLTIAVGCLFNSLLLDHTEGLMYAWLTAVLYGGLESAQKPTLSPPRPSP
jgi:O-antigen ligase